MVSFWRSRGSFLCCAWLEHFRAAGRCGLHAGVSRGEVVPATPRPASLSAVPGPVSGQEGCGRGMWCANHLIGSDPLYLGFWWEGLGWVNVSAVVGAG